MSGRVTILHGDSRELLKAIPDNTLDSCVCDPPYALVSITKRFGKAGAAPAKGNDAYMRASAGFMGQRWDNGETAFDPEFWREVFRVLKPGAHLVAFSGTRTYHRMACAIEDAGFEVRDMAQWLYGSGFPKSHDLAKQIDKTGGVWRGRVTRALPNQSVAKGVEYERVPKGEAVSDDAKAWQGWGTALKPACEPIALVRKPLSEKTVAANVLRWGTGAINVDACRIEYASEADQAAAAAAAQRLCQDQNENRGVYGRFENGPASLQPYLDRQHMGRWPANVVHDGSDEVIAAFPDRDGCYGPPSDARASGEVFKGERGQGPLYADSGSAARFFYSAKADANDRLMSKHPTVKPVALMRWLIRLVTPPGGHVLDCFAGSGTTGVAAMAEGMRCTLMEREDAYVADIRERIEHVEGRGALTASLKARRKKQKDVGGLFGEVA